MDAVGKKLALFDLDGTLFDTSEVNFYSYRDALRVFDIELDKDYFVKYCNGYHYSEFLPKIVGNKDCMDKVHVLKKKFYEENLSHARVNLQLFRIMETMKQNFHLAVVTTASRKNTMDILMYFGYDNLFELLITQEDITKTKPDPQGYLLAMEHFSAQPEDTIIFEDSDVGIQAARATMATVMVVNQF